MILISGNIGAGKTSLTHILAEHLDAKPYYEVVKHNPVLPMFYKGNRLVAKGKWHTNPYSFVLQVYFLNKRYHAIKKASENELAIMDRSIFEDAIFAKLNYQLHTMTKAEWRIYHDLLDNMLESLPYLPKYQGPSSKDLMIYIDDDYGTMIKHIKERGRQYEQPEHRPGLVKYYHRLIDAYRSWISQYNYSPVLSINGNKYDFVNNACDRYLVLKKINRKLRQLNIVK